MNLPTQSPSLTSSTMTTIPVITGIRFVLRSVVVFGLIFCAESARSPSGRLAAAEPSAARALPEVAPAEIGLTAAGVRALDELMTRYTAPDRFPAAMLLVARRGKIGYWRAFGVRDLARGDKLERNDVFRIHSLTKPITAVAVLMLWEEGKLGLDDPVSRYVPAFGKVGVYTEEGRPRPAQRPLTIRHLLTFTAGMSYGVGLGRPIPADRVIEEAKPFQRATDLDDFMRRLSELPLIGDPGTFSYGPQTDVLGKVIEVASGLTLDGFFHDRILRPLGMHETGFMVPRSALNRYASYYKVAPGRAPERLDPGDATSEQVKPPQERRDWRFLSAGGGLVSTPADYIRFAQMLANRGMLDGVRLLKGTTVDLMQAPHVRTDSPRMSDVQGPGWAAGFQVMTAPDIKAAGGGGHDGLYWMSGYANLYMWVDSAANLVGLVWAQAAPYRVYPLFDDARRAVADAMKK